MSKGKIFHFLFSFSSACLILSSLYRRIQCCGKNRILSPASSVSAAPTPDTESVLLQYSALFTAKSPLLIGDIFQDPIGEA